MCCFSAKHTPLKRKT